MLDNLIARLTDYLYRFLYLDTHSQVVLALSILMAVFGLINVLLGYRLLRFWMMLSGFLIGAAGGYFLSGFLSLSEDFYKLICIVICGAVLAIFVFAVYKAGIFIIGAGLGLILTLYLIKPRSSAVFFLCILISIALGVLTLYFSKPVLIVGTSVLGGAAAGCSATRIMEIDMIPFAVMIAAVLAIIGILVQFVMNPAPDKPETPLKRSDGHQLSDEEDACSREEQAL
ncbi:MAG: DUF4203 domain-containing protein [Blautia sp.]|nr:DUF4203 domain-containing protein [Blautia sp.]